MKMGIGLYRHMLDSDNFDFARQCGCTDLVVHLANYYDKDKIVMATNDTVNYGVARPLDPIWEEDNLKALVRAAKEKELNIHAIENFSPADWYDVLLDGPAKKQQMENLKRLITRVGRVGIHSFGYNFSFAGVWGHMKTRGRGGAESTCFDSSALNVDAPIPGGEIWNMTYAEPDGTYREAITDDELWSRLEWFLQEIIPVAQEAGVVMALHPDDPPMPRLRDTPRLVYQPHLYQRVMDLVPSPANGIDFCMGSIQEMTRGDIYDALDIYSVQDKISYVHVRNVKGKVPKYEEVFIDEGDIDIYRALSILQKNHFDGVLIPDHTPQMTCGAGWHAGMAFALGYIRAQLQRLETH